MENLFKQGLIILGAQCTGKSMLAKFITDGHDESEVLTISGRDKKIFYNKFTFSTLTEKTKIILIDDLPVDRIESLFFLIGGTIEVNRRGKNSLTINTSQIQVIVTVLSNVIHDSLLNASTMRRFKIIEVNDCGYSVVNRVTVTFKENDLSNTEGLLRALSKTFQNAKISDVLTDHSLKIATAEITKIQFANLATISDVYKKDFAFKRLNNKISIEITEMEVGSD